MALSAIDQKEYLKRYLSGDDSKPKKKRKKKHPVAKRTMVIVDDDVDINTLGPSEETVQKVEEELFDDAPTVAGMVDERPEVEQRIEEYRKSDKWKGLKDHREERSKSPADRLQTSDHKKQRHDSDSDLSPVRSKNFKRSSYDLSPVRSKNRHDSDSDLSSVRSKTRHDSDSDLSPARNMKNQDSDRNTSHKRSANRSDSDDDLSPVRSRTRHDSDGNLSPVRSKKRHDSDSDLSPVRSKQKHNSDSDLSPPRPNKRHDSDSDLSPVRTSSKRDPDGDLSPDRSKKHGSGYAKDGKVGKTSRKGKEGKGHGGSDSDLSPEKKKLDQSGKLKKTLSGHKAGLQDAQTLKKENEANRRRQDRLFEAMGDEALGKNSATVFRDKTGKKRDLAKEKAKEEEEAAKKAKENAKFQEWGKGMAQKEKQQQMVLDAAKEMTKPLARYENDRDLDSFLKEQEREGDPMLAMIRKKKNKERELAGIKEKPKYKGPAPQPNRFGIQPGYRWDGVDRSNGFEKKYFARMANNKAMQEVKYKWSVEDM